MKYIVAVLSLLTILFATATPFCFPAELTQLDSTSVMDDLLSSTVEGKPFDTKHYPYNPQGALKVINFVEYCYSYTANLRNNYGLYIYVYNPQKTNIVVSSRQNKVQIATKFDNNFQPIEYQKFNLQCVSVSEGDYDQLFYKFKVLGADTLLPALNTNERLYNVSGIELLTYGNTNATEYGIGGTYKFTGYAKGFGPDSDADSTLNSTVEELETVSIAIKHTNFRTNVSSLGANHYNEVNTAYFSIPQRFFDEYGNLQKIHAEWWEYKTKMALITSNQELYNKALPYVGTIKGNGITTPFSLYAGRDAYAHGNGYLTCNYQWSYNMYIGSTSSILGPTGNYTTDYDANIVPFIFYTEKTDLDSVFNFLYKGVDAGSVEANVVQDWIYNYRNDLGNGYIDCNGRQISVDLFEDFVDEGRTRGYNNVNIDLEDTFDLNSYDSNHTWWDKLWDYGFSWPSTDGDYKNVAPIQVLKDGDLSGNAADVSNTLLVNKEHVSQLQQFYTAEKAKGNKVVLFRFANTDYYSAPACYSEYTGDIAKSDAYVVQQTVFLDFDILDFTFNKDGAYKVIPVVSSPTDIINGFTPPASALDWGKLLLSLILLIVLLVLISPLIPLILKALWWIITLPFKAIASIVKSIKNKDKGE